MNLRLGVSLDKIFLIKFLFERGFILDYGFFCFIIVIKLIKVFFFS